ncbi:hypothetical protein ETB97_003942 [Aspergillus alliaceus]|uniref:Uncharacterized protein n=1 Tax=Petromyces alliaceus TaxID=209559 RepID=A0A8H6E4Z6_PETAA|nr:hypothetical protein ETB97_003942 [Aspergillus burnettii]
MHESIGEGSVAINQATNLPEKADFTLQPMEKLENHNNWDEWIDTVRMILDIHELQDLIKADVPKPSKSDPKYEIWRTCASIVNLWLRAHLTEDLAAKLETTHLPKQWPDETVQTISKLIHGHGYLLNGAVWIDAVLIKRSDYGTIQQFVTALQEKISAAGKVNMTITPYQATLLLLNGIETELPIFAGNVRYSMTENSWKDLTENNFFNYCQIACHEARIYGDRIFMATQAKSGNRRGTYPERKHAPPTGIGHEKHVRETRTYTMPLSGS